MGPEAFQGIQDVYFGGNMNAAPALAGQSAGLVHEVLTAGQIIDQTIAEFHRIGKHMGQLAQNASFG
jgi:enoyl-[acyl-carrier protein] reductase II